MTVRAGGLARPRSAAFAASHSSRVTIGSTDTVKLGSHAGFGAHRSEQIPAVEAGQRQLRIDTATLGLILEGIDLTRAPRRKRYAPYECVK